MQFKVLRNIKTGRRHIVSREKGHSPVKSKKYVYLNVTGYKQRGNSVSFVYDKTATFLTEACEMLFENEYIDLTPELVKELQEEYFDSLRAQGKRIVYTTTHRARNQKYEIREA